MTDHSTIPVLKRLKGYGHSGLNRSIRGYEVGELLKDYSNLIELLPGSGDIALCEESSQQHLPLTHKRLKQFVQHDFDLSPFGVPHGSRIAILLPNGPELALTIVCVVSKYCAAPINLTSTWQEIKNELESTKCVAMIIMTGATVNNDSAIQAADDRGIGVIAIERLGSITGLFRLKLLKPVSISTSITRSSAMTVNGFMAFDHPETVLLLHTSGTSGNKKLVPYSLDMIMIGVGCIISSWNLTPSDVCLNMMPLFHIGGIVRNLFAPILSGGSVISCSGFDPLIFWDLLYKSAAAADVINTEDGVGMDIDSSICASRQITWYYASPTMHHAILMEAEIRPTPLPVSSIRFIANAAGGLLPVLARKLKDTFYRAVILTSYGMTEW